MLRDNETTKSLNTAIQSLSRAATLADHNEPNDVDFDRVRRSLIDSRIQYENLLAAVVRLATNPTDSGADVIDELTALAEQHGQTVPDRDEFED